MIYLAGKTGKFLPQDLHARYAALQWLMWQMGGVGPMFGQANHFRAYAVDKIAYAIERYTNEANRLTGILDRRLSEAPYLAGDDYSIADMAVFPWMRNADRRGITLTDYPHAQRWFDAINARPAVVRAVQVLSEASSTAPHDDKITRHPVRQDPVRTSISGCGHLAAALAGAIKPATHWCAPSAH